MQSVQLFQDLEGRGRGSPKSDALEIALEIDRRGPYRAQCSVVPRIGSGSDW